MVKTLLFFSWLLFHPVHVTISSIDYSQVTNQYDVFIKVYYDDFLSDIKLNNNNSAIIISSESGNLQKDIVKKYLNEKFLLFEDQIRLNPVIDSARVVDGEVLINLNFKSEIKPEFLTVKNYLLTSLYSDQANMIIIKVNNFEEGYKLTCEIPEQTIKIK